MNKNTPRAARIALMIMTDAYDADLSRLADYMIDYCDDPAIENSPSLITAMETLTPDDDITTLLETITPLNADLAAMIAERAELCPEHFSDPANCDDEPHESPDA